MPSNKNIPQILKLLSLTAAILGTVCVPRSVRAEQLAKETHEAFERYVRASEARMDRELVRGEIFLWVDALPDSTRTQAYADLKKGQIIIQRSRGNEPATTPSIPRGLVHDWIGIVFIPGVSMSQAMALLQDYDRDAEYYSPEVLKSKLLKRSGDEFQVFLRLKQVRVATVVLDTEYAVRYMFLDAAHAYSRSYSTRITEVQNPGGPQESHRPVGDDHGFLWRLYSYWRFYQADKGVYVQCHAISLTRDVPAGLGWLLRPFIENIPSESLRFTLDATRKALMSRFANASGSSRATEGLKYFHANYFLDESDLRRRTTR